MTSRPGQCRSQLAPLLVLFGGGQHFGAPPQTTEKRRELQIAYLQRKAQRGRGQTGGLSAPLGGNKDITARPRAVWLRRF
jgi:hypothetical protein